MSEVLFLRSEPDLRSGFSHFSDLKKRLEQTLNLSQTLSDLEQLIGSVNALMKNKTYSVEEMGHLKRIRQRAYDRKRTAKASDLGVPISIPYTKPETPDLNLEHAITPDLGSQPKQTDSNPKEEAKMKIEPMPIPLEEGRLTSPIQTRNFWEGFESAIHKIDGERFAYALPGACVLFGTTILVGWFIWQQSISIYQSIGFEQPGLIAAGALMMVVGFAAFHAISRSKLALLFCIYAGCYETYLMTSGTFQDEAAMQQVRLENMPEINLLREKAEKARSAYLAHKARFEDATGDMHHNSWFKKTYLDPAWKENELQTQQYLEEKKTLEHRTINSHIAWLKILYRLGLVFLCMLLVHRVMRVITKYK